QIAITYAADGAITGYRNGKPYGKAYKSNGPATFANGKCGVAFGVRHEPAGGNRMLAGTIVQARLYARALAADEVAASAAVADFATEAEMIARLASDIRPKRDDLRTKLAALTAERNRLTARQSMKMYTAVSTQPPATHLLLRGQVTSP